MEDTEIYSGEECCKTVETDYSGRVIFNSMSDPPPLEDLTLACIAIRLCGNPDLTKYESYYLNEITKNFDNLEKNMFEKVAKISLPDLLKIKIANIIRPIGLQLRQFVDAKPDDCNLKIIYMKGATYYWTMEGTIDKVRSLKEFINSTKNLSNKEENFNSLYRMACYYCLEEYISDLWLKVLEKENEFVYPLNMHYKEHIIAYWIAVRENKLSSLIGQLRQYDNQNIYDINLNVCENMVALSVLLSNEISFKYFWYKLTENQKNSGLDKWLELALKRTHWHWATRFDFLSGYDFNYQYYEARTDIVCFLLSHLSQEKREEILKTDSEKILLALFHHWPLQRFFLPTITATFHFLKEDVYVRILSAIIFEIRERRKTELLLRKLWHLSPLRFKRAFIQFLMRNSAIIVHLISANDDVTIDMMIAYASSAEKKQIIFSMVEEPNLRNLLYEDVTAIFILDTLTSKALSSDLVVNDFKRNIVSEYADFLCFNWLRQGNIQMTEKFLNWVFQSENKIHEYKKNNIDLMRIYRSLMHSSDCEPAELFLSWYFDTDEELLQFKNTFVHGGECSACLQLLSSLFSEGQAGWDKFEKFLSFGYISSVEMVELKQFAFAVSAKFYVQNYAFEFATLFLDWCLDSSADEIRRFKTELLLSRKVFTCLIVGIPNPNWEKVKDVLQWFAPISKEVIDELKPALIRDFSVVCKNLDENVSEKKLILFDLIDSFSECTLNKKCAK